MELALKDPNLHSIFCSSLAKGEISTHITTNLSRLVGEEVVEIREVAEEEGDMDEVEIK